MSEYRTEKGRCVIVFRTSYQAKHYVENEEGKLLSGETDFFEQSVAETELIYTQDRMIWMVHFRLYVPTVVLPSQTWDRSSANTAEPQYRSLI